MKPKLTRAVRRGLQALAAHAQAGSPDDLEIDTTTRGGRRDWADVQRAIRWASDSESNPIVEANASRGKTPAEKESA
jgi:hypothetical protein